MTRWRASLLAGLAVLVAVAWDTGADPQRFVRGIPWMVDFVRRSLPPDWVNRPYHLYRVRRPIEALTGEAIPWFDQPGGGTAFVLPTSLEDLIGNGIVVEVPGREPPR